MSVSYVPPEPGWAEVIAHVLLRIVLFVVGYFVSVLITLFAILILYIVLASIPNAPDYFAAMSVTYLLALLLPWAGGIIYLVALLLSFVPALICILITEALKLRSIFLHMAIGAAVSVGTFYFMMPVIVEGSEPVANWQDICVMAAGGLVGGIFYWLIAGRKAGFRMDQPVWTQPMPAQMQPPAA